MLHLYIHADMAYEGESRMRLPSSRWDVGHSWSQVQDLQGWDFNPNP